MRLKSQIPEKGHAYPCPMTVGKKMKNIDGRISFIYDPNKSYK